jgi:hypothetical protein
MSLTKDFSRHLAEHIDQGVPLLIVDGLGAQRGIHLQKQIVEGWKKASIDRHRSQQPRLVTLRAAIGGSSWGPYWALARSSKLAK